MNAPYYSAEDILKLKEACAQDCSAYSTVEELAKLLEEKLIKIRQASYVLNEPPALSGSGPDADTADAIALHKWLSTSNPKIPRSVFGDERLWTALCHDTFADYMVRRWGADTPDNTPSEEDQNESKGKPESFGRISIRFFVKGASQRGIVRNGLARLFWAADLALEAEGNYDLVRQMFRKQDIHQNIIERSMCIDSELTKKMLKEFAQLDDDALSKAKIQLVAKLVNGAGGTRTLETVSRDDMSDSFKAAFGRLRQAPLSQIVRDSK